MWVTASGSRDLPEKPVTTLLAKLRLLKIYATRARTKCMYGHTMMGAHDAVIMSEATGICRCDRCTQNIYRVG